MMLINKNDAHEKWCPMQRVSSPDRKGSYNSVGSDHTILREDIAWCIGDSCMMWRFAHGYVGTKGYCGLAGKPVDAD
jgi:hypothetical protein